MTRTIYGQTLPKRVIDLTGKKFGQLRVCTFSHVSNQGAVWNCLCSCGTKIVVGASPLRSGNTKSCGCRKHQTRPLLKHGDYRTPEHMAWVAMRRRCSDAKLSYAHRYVGRGIGVCTHWDTYENFIYDMGDRPTTIHTLERHDNDKGYGPCNCYWASRQTQSRNRDYVKLSLAKAERIRDLYTGGATQDRLADTYGVAQTTISKIILNKSWI